MRFEAFYEPRDPDGTVGGPVLLPVLRITEHGKAIVLTPEGKPAVAEDTIALESGGQLEGFELIPIPDPISAEPGWIADIWSMGSQSEPLGSYPVLAWEPSAKYDLDTFPASGHAIILVTDDVAATRLGVWTGPHSTSALSGSPRFRRSSEPAYGPFEEDPYLQ